MYIVHVQYPPVCMYMYSCFVGQVHAPVVREVHDSDSATNTVLEPCHSAATCTCTYTHGLVDIHVCIHVHNVSCYYGGFTENIPRFTAEI